MKSSWLLLLFFPLTVCGTGRSLGKPRFDPEFRKRSFDRMFETLADRFPYFDSVEEDWDALVANARRQAIAATSREQFYRAVAKPLAVLRDPHLELVPPESPAEPWTAAPIELVLVSGRYYVVDWEPKTRLHPRPPGELSVPELLAVDGIEPQRGLLPALLQGTPESPVTLRLSWPNGAITEQIIHRLPANRELSHRTTGSMEWNQSSGLSWVRRQDLTMLHVETFTPERIQSSQDEMLVAIRRAFEHLAGTKQMILDLQYNNGGQVALGRELGGFLVKSERSIGELTERFLGLIPFTRDLRLKPRKNGFRGPLVLLINGHTLSTAEHLARTLQAHGRAILIGERTSGAEAATTKMTLDDGTTFRFGERPLIPQGASSFQGIGIVPDIEIPLTVEDIRTHGVFQAQRRVHRARLRAALDVLESPIPLEALPEPTIRQVILGTTTGALW